MNNAQNAEEKKFQNKHVIEAYKRWAPILQAHHEDAFHIIEQALTERTLQNYLSQIPKDTAVLDIGGGDGRWSRYLAKHGFTNILLADLSPDLLDVARKAARQEDLEKGIFYEVLDIESMVLPKRFGIFLCLGGVLSHCLDYKTALRNLFKVLLENGIGIISVDSYHEAKVTSQYMTDPEEINILLSQGISKQFFNSRLPYFSKYFHYEELCDAIENCGFKVLQVQSRPQITAWDLSARFNSTDEFRKVLKEEIILSEKKERLKYGYQLEFVVSK